MTNLKKESGVMNLTRRGFIKASSAVGSAAAIAGGISLPFTSKPVVAAVAQPTDEKIVWSACTVNCGSRCPLRMHVQDGEIKYVETDNTVMSIGTGESPIERGAERVPTTAIFSTFLFTLTSVCSS